MKKYIYRFGALLAIENLPTDESRWLKAFGRKERIEFLLFDLIEALVGLSDGVDDGNRVIGDGHVHDNVPTWEHRGKPIVMTQGQAQAAADMVTLLRKVYLTGYRNGYTDGSNLLKHLAEGNANVDEFDRKSDRYRNRKPAD